MRNSFWRNTTSPSKNVGCVSVSGFTKSCLVPSEKTTACLTRATLSPSRAGIFPSTSVKTELPKVDKKTPPPLGNIESGLKRLFGLFIARLSGVLLVGAMLAGCSSLRESALDRVNPKMVQRPV